MYTNGGIDRKNTPGEGFVWSTSVSMAMFLVYKTVSGTAVENTVKASTIAGICFKYANDISSTSAPENSGSISILAVGDRAKTLAVLVPDTLCDW
jgi:hypothetical protein